MVSTGCECHLYLFFFVFLCFLVLLLFLFTSAIPLTNSSLSSFVPFSGGHPTPYISINIRILPTSSSICRAPRAPSHQAAHGPRPTANKYSTRKRNWVLVLRGREEVLILRKVKPAPAGQVGFSQLQPATIVSHLRNIADSGQL